MATLANPGDPATEPVVADQSVADSPQDTSSAHHDASSRNDANGSIATEPVSEKPKAPPPMMDPSQFPDGGLAAWLTVAGGWCCAFVSFGWVNAIGVFQEYYEQDFLRGYDPSAIAWIVSLQAFFAFLGAPIVGRIYDNHGPRYLLAGGTFLHVFGLMMLSLSTKYYQLILSQGVCSPIGASMVLYPAMSTTVSWFYKRRALALGIMVSGSSLGGVIFPIMLQRLIPTVGFGWAVRACAFLILGLLAFATVATTSRIPPSPKPWSPMDFARPFSEPVFSVVCLANFFGFLGLFIPFNFITLSAIDVGTDPYLASYLIAILNAGSIIGRIFPGWAADKLGKFNIQIAMCALSFIVNLAIWLPARGPAPMIVFAVLYGIASGAFVSLAPALIAQITTDMRQIGVRTGTMFATVSVAALIGNPIAGALQNDDDGGYLYVQIFTGVIIAVATIIFIIAKSMCKGKLLKKF